MVCASSYDWLLLLLIGCYFGLQLMIGLAVIIIIRWWCRLGNWDGLVFVGVVV